MARAEKPPARRHRGRPPRRPKPADIWPSERRPWGAIWRHHGRVARESFSFIFQHLGATALVWMLIGIGLALPTSLYLAELNLAGIAGDWRDASGFSVYFEPGADAERPAALARRLTDEPEVQRVRLITPEQALAEFRDHSGTEVASALALLTANPLPATLRVIAAPAAVPARLILLANQAGRSPGVAEVVIERTWLERLTAMRAVIRRASWVAAAVLGIGAILVSSASVRLAIEARLTEVRVHTLVGASNRFIRRPFLYLGAIYGAGGALVATMLISAVLSWLEEPLTRLFGSYGEGLELAGFDPILVLVLLAIGAILGMTGAIAASNQRLRETIV